MAELRETHGTRRCTLLPEHLIGRGAQCALRLDASKKYVSSQHALIRWVGSGWEVLDRGSRNGTRVNGAPVEPGRACRLAKGSVLTFGHADESWTFTDTGEPRVMAFDLDSGEARVEQYNLIGIPSNESPECTLFLDGDGVWRLEHADGQLQALEDGQTFELGGKRFLFSRPSSSALTAGSEPADAAAVPASLHFAVSSDEDFVELTLHYPTRAVALGSRAHNYLLLTLARQRLADEAAQIAEPSRGWMDKDELATGLRMSPAQIDGEIFRIRKHFAAHGLAEAATVVERRARTRLIRLGVAHVAVVRR
jgi:pSer/pThr/pTyr-binding forkhead associated (FHA) protein